MCVGEVSAKESPWGQGRSCGTMTVGTWVLGTVQSKALGLAALEELLTLRQCVPDGS